VAERGAAGSFIFEVTMNADLRCGRETVSLELPDSTVVLEVKPLAPLADPAAGRAPAL
jgi:hypothetical protein